MPTVAKCPECSEPMRLSDAAAGRRVRCPACKHVFVAPGAEEEPELVECDIVEEPPERPAKRPRVDEEEEDDRPRRNTRRDEEEDEDDDRPRRRRRDEDEEDRPVERRRRRARWQAQASPMPMILGILSCLFSFFPVVGIPLAGWAIQNANEEMDRLPAGDRFDSAFRQYRLSRVLGVIGMVLSFILGLVYLAMRAAMR